MTTIYGIIGGYLTTNDAPLCAACLSERLGGLNSSTESAYSPIFGYESVNSTEICVSCGDTIIESLDY